MGNIYIDNRGGGSTGGIFPAILSFFVPGLGQFLLGRWLRAFAHLVMSILLWVVLLGWVIHLYSAWDAAH